MDTMSKFIMSPQKTVTSWSYTESPGARAVRSPLETIQYSSIMGFLEAQLIGYSVEPICLYVSFDVVAIV
jgi:hypothetical protein